MSVPSNLPWAKKYPSTVDWSASIAVGPVYGLLDQAVEKYPKHIALDSLDRLYTYSELGKLVNRAARGLQDMGLKKGDRLGLFLPNTPYYVILYYAAMKAGLTVVNFNPLYVDGEIEKQIKDSGTTVMATIDVPDVYSKLALQFGKTPLQKIIFCPMADILPFPKSILYRLFRSKKIVPLPHDDRHIAFAKLLQNTGGYTPVDLDINQDVAVLQYTGGTTGVAKGAMLTHANITANVMQSRLALSSGQDGAEITLGVLPFFHVFAMTVVMNLSIQMGGRIAMLPLFDLKQVVETIDKKKPTLFPGVPTIYTAINNYKNLSDYNLHSIKFCISGGAPLPVEVKRDFERLTGCVLVEGYGLSETSPVTHCNPADGENKTGSIGLPLPGTYVDIVSLDDRTTLMPQGERGEVCIRGPQVMKGYWNHPEETAAVMVTTPDGVRLHTGDVGYIDEDGYTFIVDRIKDMIVAGGFKIYPRHVEEEIYRHEAVEECVVIGIHDDYRGQTVKAFIKLRAGKTVTKDELKAFLKDKLSPIAMPKQIEFRDSLPKTTIGKLSRKMLAEEEASKAAPKA